MSESWQFRKLKALSLADGDKIRANLDVNYIDNALHTIGVRFSRCELCGKRIVLFENRCEGCTEATRLGPEGPKSS